MKSSKRNLRVVTYYFDHNQACDQTHNCFADAVDLSRAQRSKTCRSKRAIRMRPPCWLPWVHPGHHLGPQHLHRPRAPKSPGAPVPTLKVLIWMLFRRPKLVTPTNSSYGMHIPGVALWSWWFFLHGWRRHVCRECTGHLALLGGESPAKPKQPNKANTQQPKQTNNTGAGLGKRRLVVSCRRETNLRRGETGGPSNYAKRTLSTQCAFAVPFALGTVPGDPGIVTMDASLLKRLGRPTCRFVSCTCKIGRHFLFCTGGDAMCAENAQVTLRYLEESYRPRTHLGSDLKPSYFAFLASFFGPAPPLQLG